MSSLYSEHDAALPTRNGEQAAIRELERTVAELRAENTELRRELLRHLFPQETAEPFNPADHTLVTPQEMLADLDAIDAE